MLDFSEIRLVKNPNDNFVGIRKSESGDDYEFWLPNGFDDFPEGEEKDFDQIRDLFFKMYRTFRKFENDNQSNRINTNNPDYQQDQDQTTVSSGGLSLQTEEGEEVTLYSKLRMIERVLETYNDLAINSIQKKIKRTNDLDYSQLYKYLDRAVYLENDAMYVDTMDLPRPVLRYESTDIVYLYCYILDEIVQQLDEDVPDSVKCHIQDISFLAQHFKDDYLTSEQSIFAQDTFLETTNILKEALDNIEQHTYYKDTDYWVLYEAIETFLYGELSPDLDDGEYWGIKGFSLIWEDMCNTYFFKHHKDNICCADTDIKLNGHVNDKRKEDDINRVGNFPINKDKEKWLYSGESDIDDENKQRKLQWHELIVIEFDKNLFREVLKKKKRNGDKSVRHQYFPSRLYEQGFQSRLVMSRFLRPDLVLKSNQSNGNIELEIIDYKDVPLDVYINPSSAKDYKKRQKDIIKQLTYELSLQQKHKVSHNKFFIPYYYKTIDPNNLGEVEIILPNGISIFKANFFYIQNQYLQENL